MHSVDVSNMSEYFGALRDLRSRWYPDPSDQNELWFRGHGRRDWSLLPGLYRPSHDVWDDATLLHAFRSLAASLGRPGDSSWDWYFRAQHYGLPTRLLDWTTGALPALYFALAEEIEEGDRTELRNRSAIEDPGFGDDSPVVWLMDAATLNQASFGPGYDHLITPGEFLDMYLPEQVSQDAPVSLASEEGELFTNEKPIAIYPRWTNKRVLAQQGMFTIHGRGRTTLEELAEAESVLKLARIVIARNRVSNFWDDLQSAGINRLVLFPELESIARYIRTEYELLEPDST